MSAPQSLRDEVRAVVAASATTPYARCDSWMRGHDPAFTRTLAAAGLVGLTWPAALGGRGLGAVDRLVVTEELLRVGAPVAAHWIADRQIGPAILRHGTPDLQQRFLPGIASGELTFCLGMSESESGSDLAAVRTRALPVAGGFRLTGRKIWTSHAHRSTHAYVLARTETGGAKHEGLTELVVDLASDGVEVRPILDLSGEHHFNETIFEDVWVPAENVIGGVGRGWQQVTEQLAFERGGMERVLSSYPLLATLLQDPDSADVDPVATGVLVARLHTLRAMALGVASAMDRGQAPVQQAALLKYLGTGFEADVVDHFRDSVGVPPTPGTGLASRLADGIVAVPGATLRGGATEVLLTIVGREELSPRLSGGATAGLGVGDPDLAELVTRVLGDHERDGADDAGLPPVWRTAVDLGWSGVSVDEELGGSGGDLADLAAIVAGLSRNGFSAPVAETALAGRLVTAAGGRPEVSTPATVALGTGLRATRTENGWRLDGRVGNVPWASVATSIVVAADSDEGEVLALVTCDSAGSTTGLTVESAVTIAGEPRDTIVCDGVAAAALGGAGTASAARRTAATLLVAGTVGALEAAASAARDHVTVREQFGKPLAAFQAVSHHVARMAAQVTLARVALHAAVAEDLADGPGWRVLAARVVAARASSEVARTAHQLLGAMGITEEHELHRSTLRLWAWRDDQVSERAAARRRGGGVLAGGPEILWDWVVHERPSLTDDNTDDTAWEGIR